MTTAAPEPAVAAGSATRTASEPGNESVNHTDVVDRGDDDVEKLVKDDGNGVREEDADPDVQQHEQSRDKQVLNDDDEEEEEEEEDANGDEAKEQLQEKAVVVTSASSDLEVEQTEALAEGEAKDAEADTPSPVAGDGDDYDDDEDEEENKNEQVQVGDEPTDVSPVATNDKDEAAPVDDDDDDDDDDDQNNNDYEKKKEDQQEGEETTVDEQKHAGTVTEAHDTEDAENKTDSYRGEESSLVVEEIEKVTSAASAEEKGPEERQKEEVDVVAEDDDDTADIAKDDDNHKTISITTATTTSPKADNLDVVVGDASETVDITVNVESKDGDDEINENQEVYGSTRPPTISNDPTGNDDDVLDNNDGNDIVLTAETESKQEHAEEPVQISSITTFPDKTVAVVDTAPSDESTTMPQQQQQQTEDLAAAAQADYDAQHTKVHIPSEPRSVPDETTTYVNDVGKEETMKVDVDLTVVPSDEEPKVAEKPKPSAADPTRKAKPRPAGLTFAAAFGDSSQATAISPLASPPMAETTPGAPHKVEVSQGTPGSDEDTQSSTPNSASHSALSASRNKKVSDRISKYVENVAHQPRPGDFVQLIKRTNSNPSSLNPKMYSPTPSPVSLHAPRKMLHVDSENLPDVKSVREMFEESSKHSETNEFEFGETFRQKKRYEQLSGKAKEREAKMSMRGFDEVEFFQGRTASGEVDTSSLGKIFTFELSSNESISLPDGICKVNYKKIKYHAMVFVVHRTRGMLLLHVAVPGDGSGKVPTRQIPGGSVNEDEFLRAAKQSGSSQVQLQIAAREAAARQLYEKTGLDIRDNVERFKPAVLKMHTQVDARGVTYPKNEHANKLYYFLQVDEDDFEALASNASNDKNGGSPVRLVRPSEEPGDSPVALKLAKEYNDFTFIKDPVATTKVLKESGENEVNTALQMIMNEAQNDGHPDAKAAVYSSKDSVAESTPADEKTGHLVRTVGLIESGKGNKMDSHSEVEINHKPSTDTADVVTEVQCCCGWW